MLVVLGADRGSEEEDGEEEVLVTEVAFGRDGAAEDVVTGGTFSVLEAHSLLLFLARVFFKLDIFLNLDLRIGLGLGLGTRVTILLISI